MKNNKILEVKNLRKTFSQSGNLIVASDDVNFVLNKGETIGLVGESGSGKTTIGRTIIGLHKPTSGQILLNGLNIGGKNLSSIEKEELKNNIQMIFQDPYSSLNEQKNIMSIVSEPVSILGLHTKRAKKLKTDAELVSDLFKNDLLEKYENRIIEFRKLANKEALKLYAKLENNFKTIKFNKKTKKANLDELMNEYFNEKRKTNMIISNNILSINVDLLSYLEEVKEKILKKDISREKKAYLNKKIKLQKIIDKGNHSNEWIKKHDEFIVMNNIFNEYKTFKKEYIHESNNAIKNEISRWDNNVNRVKNNSQMTSTYSQYNYLIVKKESMNYMLKASKEINETSFIVKEGLLESFDELYDSIKKILKNEVNKKIPTLKSNAKVIRLETIVYELIDKQVKDQKKKIFKDLILTKENVNEYIYSKYFKIKNNKFKTYKELVANKEATKNIFKKEKNKVDNTEIVKKAIAELKLLNEEIMQIKAKSEKKNATKLKVKADKWDAKFEIMTSKIVKLRTKFNTKFEATAEKIKELDLPGFNDLETKNSPHKFDKYMKSMVKKSNKENEAFDKELGRALKETEITIDFITNGGKQMNKMKKIILKSFVFNALEAAGLTKAHAYRYPHEFSGGMRQRVGIARAIISKPKIIIADEPIAALDLSIQAQIVNVLKELQKKDDMSMIFIAHDLSMVEYISDKVLIIHNGKIVEKGLTKEIFGNPIHPYTKNLLASTPDISNISKGFSKNTFESKYLDSYSIENAPTYHKITGTHFVLADERQFKKWKK